MTTDMRSGASRKICATQNGVDSDINRMTRRHDKLKCQVFYGYSAKMHCVEISCGSGQILFAINAGIVYASEAVKKTDQKKGLP